ncbi:hypothetical protein GCM10020295_60910 [Streptomyces cinereospinus]
MPRPAGGARGLTGAPRAGAPLGGAVEQARLGAALARIGGTPVERLLSRPEAPAGRALAARGLPARTADGFLRPLLAALLCDPELTTSSRCADLALRAFASGRMCVPEGGAGALPELLARGLPPGTVRTGVRVTGVSTTAVSTAEHGEFRCRAVLLATDARAAAELLPGLRVPACHPVTVVHHTTDEPPATGASLLLDADRGGPVAHTAVVSAVDPTRAPQGRALVSSTVLGTPPDEVDTAVRMHLARLYGASTARWETLAVHHTAEAVPVMRPPHDLRRPVRLLAGLYVCGDHRDTSTVQGALHSAHRASAAILADLGAAGSTHRADPAPPPPTRPDRPPLHHDPGRPGTGRLDTPDGPSPPTTLTTRPTTPPRPARRRGHRHTPPRAPLILGRPADPPRPGPTRDRQARHTGRTQPPHQPRGLTDRPPTTTRAHPGPAGSTHRTDPAPPPPTQPDRPPPTTTRAHPGPAGSTHRTDPAPPPPTQPDRPPLHAPLGDAATGTPPRAPPILGRPADPPRPTGDATTGAPPPTRDRPADPPRPPGAQGPARPRPPGKDRPTHPRPAEHAETRPPPTPDEPADPPRPAGSAGIRAPRPPGTAPPQPSAATLSR